MEEISGPILKEKARQDELLNAAGDSVRAYDKAYFEQHKNTLENMKEYLEEQLIKIEKLMDLIGFPTLSEDEMLWSIKNMVLLGMKNQLRMDIKELTKMIGKYE